MSIHDQFDDNEWTADERVQLDALATERRPSAALKARTLGVLRAEGIIQDRPRISMVMIASLALAASLVFAAGALVGYSAAARRTTETPERETASVRAVARNDSAPATAQASRHVVWF